MNISPEVAIQAKMLAVEAGKFVPWAVEVVRDYVNLMGEHPEFMVLIGGMYTLIDSIIDEVQRTKGGNRSGGLLLLGRTSLRLVIEVGELWAGVALTKGMMSGALDDWPMITRIGTGALAGALNFAGLTPDTVNRRVFRRLPRLVRWGADAVDQALNETVAVASP